MTKHIVAVAMLGGLFGMFGAVAAELKTPQETDNLIARPGFEASEPALKSAWSSGGSGYQVDRAEKHSGNQSIRLVATGKGEGALAICTLPVARIRTPTMLIISGWSKAMDVTGAADGHYAIYVDVNYTDGSNLYGPNVPFSTGTHDWEYRSVRIPLPKPAKRVSVYLLLRGDHAGTAWFDDLYAAAYAEGRPRYEGSPVAYETPRAVEEARRKVVMIEQQAATLERLIQGAEVKGMDVQSPKVSLTVARLFANFLLKDAALEATDYPADMIDFRIFGRDETLRRIQQLSGFEAEQTEQILARAIQQLQRVIANPELQVKVPPAELQQVSVRNGAFSDGNRPVFISGIYGFPFRPDDSGALETAKALGANLLGPLHISHAASRSWDEFDDSYFEKQVVPMYRAAAAKGMLVNSSLWNYRAPAWLAKLAPDIDVGEDKGWFRDCMDLDHPLTERFNRVWFKYAAARLKTLPNNFCYSLMGEEWCHPGFRGPHTAQRYENWLKTKHGTIAALNRAWRTNYRDFQEAAARKSSTAKGGHYDRQTLAPSGKDQQQSQQTKGELFDWNTFNAHRLTSFNQSQINGIKQSDPEGLWTCWPAAGCLVSAPLGGFDPAYGRNREDILRQSSVSGWDGGIFAVESGPSTRRLPESHWAKYSLGWRDEMIYYDFAKSLCPEQPVFDPELHTLTSVYHISPLGVPADYFRTTLWMEHLHGLGAHLLWWWGRNADGTPRYGEFLGGLLTQPQLLEAWGRTVLELRRLTDYVALFPQLQRKVRILYSEPSAIHEPKAYPLQVRDAYEALYFLDYPVGFVTERMIREGRLADCGLLVIPAAKHVAEDVVAKIREYHQRGGRLAVIGRQSLQCDEYGNERAGADLLKGHLYLAGSTPEEYAPQLDRLYEEVGIVRPVRVAGRDGKPVWGVELRTARKDQQRIISLVNVNRHAVEIVLKVKDGVAGARDLVARQPVVLKDPLVLEPRRPMLISLP